jgi:hypothetical protein
MSNYNQPAPDPNEVDDNLANAAQIELLAQEEALTQAEAEEAQAQLAEQLAQLYMPN